MSDTHAPQKVNRITVFFVILVIVSLLAGGIIGYTLNSFTNQDNPLDLQNQLTSLQSQVAEVQANLTRLQTTTPHETEADFQELTQAVNQIRNQIAGIQTQINQIENAPTPTAPPSQDIASLQTEINSLRSQLTTLQQQVTILQQAPTIPPVVNQDIFQNITYVTGENISLSQLFDEVKTSVVVVQGLLRQVDFFGRVFYTQVQGSGFVHNRLGRNYVLTNNHVVSGTINTTVTFNDGRTFQATILGFNADADFAILNTTTSIDGYRALDVISSSTLRVGDPVIVVGTPYGLAGSMSTGIVSALNRTISTGENTEISNVIQTTAPLNPGNSGGPVMNYNGQVVGIATAIVQESQGIGFAVPSDTALSELQRILPA